MAFAQKQLKLTFYISAIVTILNLLLNLVLIPSQGPMGAAISFLCSSIIQAILYKIFVRQQKLAVPIFPLLISMALAASCTFLVIRSNIGPILGVLLGLGGYGLLIFMTRILHPSDLKQLTGVLNKKQTAIDL
jgi:O-antigen/teichoic acid export membrane protein